MAIFNKKPETDQRTHAQGAGAPATVPGPAPAPAAAAAAPANHKRGYGINEAIDLMRSLPVDQHPELVVRVVRATLGSLSVRLPDIIEDAARKEKTVQDRIAAVHREIADLEKQLEGRRHEIATLEADLDETTRVKERLQMAESGAAGTSPELPVEPMPHLNGSGPIHA